MANTIILKGEVLRKEGQASAAITPGHLVEIGGTNDFQVHSTAGGPAQRSFALENDLIGGDIATAYALGDDVQVGVFDGGAVANAWIAAGQTVAKGSKLVSAGDGTLAVMGTGEEAGVVAIATAALNNSASSFAARLAVEVV